MFGAQTVFITNRRHTGNSGPFAENKGKYCTYKKVNFVASYKYNLI